ARFGFRPRQSLWIGCRYRLPHLPGGDAVGGLTMTAALGAARRRSYLAACVAPLLLLLAQPVPASIEEEGDDGADEIPAPIGKPPPTVAQLVRDYHLFAEDKAKLSFVAPRIPDLSRYSDT